MRPAAATDIKVTYTLYAHSLPSSSHLSNFSCNSGAPHICGKTMLPMNAERNPMFVVTSLTLEA
eukprot:CAMPEP_0203997942 /NCGR_PEP_ID=MMETSP0360-20130528/13723_1 /ASSEMBLY_ACC=CAM_ASM_000342 /TAXON_ID=268821 /ORGANISM="Scrippsiella Hangoei, Strain SHTV-5" /LENGTH=63 /DNA_ID=CAMNT_0050938943 /DNA_START=368 /DNA_END=559 /DNA_ORIENTATION=-